jgi:hypothetical protein
MVENAFLCYSIYVEGNGFLGIIIEKIWNYVIMPACVPRYVLVHCQEMAQNTQVAFTFVATNSKSL